MSKIESYFKEHGKKWIQDSYEEQSSIAQSRLQLLMDIIKIIKPASLLDVGCGDGRFLRHMNDIPIRAGIDYSPSMLELATTDDNVVYETIDLNSDSCSQKLGKIGKYELITMMGVVHYLREPLKSLKLISACAHDAANIIISFRNRLYNTVPNTKYFNSELTKIDKNRLEGEKEFWDRRKLESNNLIADINEDKDGAELLLRIMNDNYYEGVTDPFWNPNQFENWRQFTPLDAIALLGLSGFDVMQIIPLYNKNDEALNEAAHDNSLVLCTSFMLVGKKP